MQFEAGGVGKCCVSGNDTGAYILTGNTVPSVGEESLNTTSIVQLIPLIFARQVGIRNHQERSDQTK